MAHNASGLRDHMVCQMYLCIHHMSKNSLQYLTEYY